MRVTIGSADPGFEPILLDVKKNIYLTEEYYDRDDASLSSRLCLYARDVIDGRWPEVEHLIKDPLAAFDYAFWVIGGPWSQAEQYIRQDECWWDEYCQVFGV